MWSLHLNCEPGGKKIAGALGVTVALGVASGCGGGGAGYGAATAPVPTPSPSPSPSPSPTPTPVPAPASTVVSASCEYVDVSAALNRSGLGTTIQIPAGDCNWGTAQLSVPAGIFVQGAGRDATTIRRQGRVSNTNFLVAFDCSNGLRASFAGIALVGNGNGTIEDNGLGLLNGCSDFAVFDSQFSNFTFSGLYVGNAPGERGVIYNNNFINNFSASLANLGYGVVVYGGGAWPALSLGSQNAVFVEDNFFSGNRHNIASNNGSQYVFRHNAVVGQDAAKDYAMTDAHGLSSSPRGSRSYEIYENQYTTNLSSGLQRAAIGIRGGDGVIFNNTASDAIARTIELTVEGFSCGAYPGPDQIRVLYIWNVSPNPGNIFSQNGVANDCPASVQLGRDYFLQEMPGYIPYMYPHPLRGR
ncbi:MAG TPA: hypothetical protein VF472_13200 [Burkholderiaceae bacterium]